MTLSSTEELCTGSTHEYNSDDTPQRRLSKYRSSSSPPSSPCEIDEEVQEEIEELLDSVPDIANNFTVINKIGSGTFSSVYVAQLKNLPDVKQMFALKYLIPTSHPSRIENELKCLQQIGGHDNVMGVKACLRHRDHIVIVMPYFPHERFQDYVASLSVKEVRDYLRALLVALRRVHSVDIIHRDVKPSNFLYNSKIQQYALVDFGLAQKAPAQQVKLANPQSQNKSTTNQKEGSNSKPETESSRRTRSDDTEVTKQVKRKHSQDSHLENSPKKKRMLESPSHDLRDKSRKLAEIDMNVPHPIRKTDTKINKLDSSHVITQQEPIIKCDTNSEESVIQQPSNLMPKSLFKQSDRSLSKTLLRKRAIEMQQKTMEQNIPHAIQLAAPGVSAEKVQKKTCTMVVEKGGKQMYRAVAPSTCECFGKPQICTICMSRSSQHAPRAGTPGFRAPEVLLKCPDQTTAVDMWSAGVIFLSLLSGRYPFFKAPDDITALAQIVALFGSNTVRQAALAMGKNLITSPEVPALNLKTVCHKLHGTKKDKKHISSESRSNHSAVPESVVGWDCVPDSAYDLLSKILDLNPATRATADEALQHDFFTCQL